MKQAKKRPSPNLSRLISSIRRASRAIDSALGYIGAANHRLAKLEQLRKGSPADWASKNLAPVGQEVVDECELSPIDQMLLFMSNAPQTKVSTEAIRALIDEGRD